MDEFIRFECHFPCMKIYKTEFSPFLLRMYKECIITLDIITKCQLFVSYLTFSYYSLTFSVTSNWKKKWIISWTPAMTVPDMLTSLMFIQYLYISWTFGGGNKCSHPINLLHNEACFLPKIHVLLLLLNLRNVFSLDMSPPNVWKLNRMIKKGIFDLMS